MYNFRKEKNMEKKIVAVDIYDKKIGMVTKEDAHKLIDSIPGDGVFILTYSMKTGISDNGKYIKKKKGNKYVDKAKTVVLSKSKVTTLNLHDKFFNDFEECKGEYLRDGIVRTIMIPQIQ